jgi:hypothetical protein
VDRISDATLLQSLEQLESGQPVESILHRFSDVATRLSEFLETTRRLERLSAESPAAVQQRAKASFLAQAAVQAERRAKGLAWLTFSPGWLAPAVAVALLVLLVGIVVPASASAVPGDVLYGTKRAVEQWRLFIAADPDAEAELMASFREERFDEVLHLLSTARSAEVSFEATVQSMGETQWTVGGLPVEVDPQTVIVGSPRVDAEVRVTGLTRFGRLYADEIQVLDDGDDLPGVGIEDDDGVDDGLSDDGLDDQLDDDDDQEDVNDAVDGELDDDDLKDDDLDDDDLDDDDLDDDDLDDDPADDPAGDDVADDDETDDSADNAGGDDDGSQDDSGTGADDSSIDGDDDGGDDAGGDDADGGDDDDDDSGDDVDDDSGDDVDDDGGDDND